jgi:DNA-binding MarR family transcriptional regulator
MARDGAGDGDRALDPKIMLEVLSAVEQDSNLSQRSLSRGLGIALGLANTYVRRCVRKGLVKVRQAPVNRYGYYLTPKGFAEKTRLTAEYLSVSLGFFRDARHQCTALLQDCANRSLRTCVLVGDGDLAEIAVLSAAEANVVVLCIVDETSRRGHCAGVPVVPSLRAAARLCDGDGISRGNGGIDIYMITDVQAPQTTYEVMARAVAAPGRPDSRILTPPLLRIVRAGAGNGATGEKP